MSTFIEQVQPLIPTVQLVAGKDFFWSPGQQLITYKAAALKRPEGQWALLHEVAHAVLDHRSYASDFDLLRLEVAAWSEAERLGRKLSIEVDAEHVQDCLDTYRDWLHQRSTCPTCSTVSLQLDSQTYRCHNCHTSWQVTTSRFCRPYRLRHLTHKQKSSEENPQTTFA